MTEPLTPGTRQLAVLDGIRGQAGPVGYMRTALSSSRLGHAYLLVGPEGVGRRTLARAVAAALACPRGGCGECAVCRASLAGGAPGLVEIEPQGRTITVERIRELRTELSRHPGGWMVIVIDPASALGAAAANALLKSLEEPPSSTVFFLLTESEETILPTIRSRCQLIRFGLLTDEEVSGLLVDRGVEQTDADSWAKSARGHMDRAVAAATDPEAGERRRELLSALADTWNGLPDGRERLYEALAAQVHARQGAVRTSGDLRAADEMAFIGSGRGSAGIRSGLEDRTKREMDRAATSATREVCDAMAGWLIDTAAAPTAAAPTAPSGDIVGALSAIQEALAILEYNVDQTRVLDSLTLRVAACGASTIRR